MIEGWQQGPLISFSELISTGPFGSMLHKSDYSSDGVPLVNPINIVDGTIVPDMKKQVGASAVARLSNFVLKTGDVVVGRRGEIGRCAVVGAREAGWVCGTGCFFIRPRSSTSPQFLANLLRSPAYRQKLERASTGATMSNLSNASLAELSVAVPPLPEQRRIVAILDEAFEAIATAKANTEENLQNAREVFASALASTFSGVAEAISLSDISLTISDGDHAPPPKAPSGVPFITISNIDKETREIDFTNTFAVPREYFEGLKSHRRPRAGDVLYTVTGSFGIPVLVAGDTEFCFQRHIGLIRPRPDVNSRWLAYALLSPAAFAQADAGATGTAQRTVSLSTLRALKLPKVASDAQCRDADRLDALNAEVDRLKRASRAKLAALDELKGSLLHQAFTGQLTAKSTDKQLEAVA